MMKRLALLTLILASAAFATTLLAVDVPALSRGADAIVIGTVTRSTARMTAEGGRIVTDTEIQVTQTLKGKASGTVVVMQPGGIVGDVGQRVEGVAPFRVGEEVLVFLEARGSERFLVAGMIQGKFRLERTSDGSAVYAVPESVSSARLLDPATRQETTSGLKTTALPVLKAQIAAALAAPQPIVEPTRPVTPKAGR